jgi:hypothetical protein
MGVAKKELVAPFFIIYIPQSGIERRVDFFYTIFLKFLPNVSMLYV